MSDKDSEEDDEEDDDDEDSSEEDDDYEREVRKSTLAKKFCLINLPISFCSISSERRHISQINPKYKKKI